MSTPLSIEELAIRYVRALDEYRHLRKQHALRMTQTDEQCTNIKAASKAWLDDADDLHSSDLCRCKNYAIACPVCRETMQLWWQVNAASMRKGAQLGALIKSARKIARERAKETNQ